MEFIVKNWVELSSIVIAFFGLVIPVYKYLFDKNLQLRDVRFNTYHLLIKKLVQPELHKENVINKEFGILHNEYTIMQDRQIATIFELRNFPEYFELSERLLNKLRKEWESDPFNIPVINEICYTLSYITIYRRNLYRFLRFTKVFSFVADFFVYLEMSRVKY